MPKYALAKALCVAALATASACGSGTTPSLGPGGAAIDDSNVGNPAAGGTLASEAKALKAAIPSISKLVTITEANDPNKLIGRPNQYTGAIVLQDSRGFCGTYRGQRDETSIDCGAKIEQFPSEAAARQRSAYILGIQASAGPMAGSEWNYIKGGMLLRVSGKVPPSANKEYKAAFLR